MPKIKANNITINYEQQGAGEPLLLIPYLAADNACYDFQVADYAKQFTCISLDPRGAGESDKPAGTWSIENFANDMLPSLPPSGRIASTSPGYRWGRLSACGRGQTSRAGEIVIAPQPMGEIRPLPQDRRPRLAVDGQGPWQRNRDDHPRHLSLVLHARAHSAKPDLSRTSRLSCAAGRPSRLPPSCNNPRRSSPTMPRRTPQDQGADPDHLRPARSRRSTRFADTIKAASPRANWWYSRTAPMPRSTKTSLSLREGATRPWQRQSISSFWPVPNRASDGCEEQSARRWRHCRWSRRIPRCVRLSHALHCDPSGSPTGHFCAVRAIDRTAPQHVVGFWLRRAAPRIARNPCLGRQKDPIQDLSQAPLAPPHEQRNATVVLMRVWQRHERLFQDR